MTFYFYKIVIHFSHFIFAFSSCFSLTFTVKDFSVYTCVLITVFSCLQVYLVSVDFLLALGVLRRRAQLSVSRRAGEAGRRMVHGTLLGSATLMLIPHGRCGPDRGGRETVQQLAEVCPSVRRHRERSICTACAPRTVDNAHDCTTCNGGGMLFVSVFLLCNFVGLPGVVAYSSFKTNKQVPYSSFSSYSASVPSVQSSTSFSGL